MSLPNIYNTSVELISAVDITSIIAEKNKCREQELNRRSLFYDSIINGVVNKICMHINDNLLLTDKYRITMIISSFTDSLYFTDEEMEIIKFYQSEINHCAGYVHKNKNFHDAIANKLKILLINKGYDVELQSKYAQILINIPHS